MEVVRYAMHFMCSILLCIPWGHTVSCEIIGFTGTHNDVLPMNHLHGQYTSANVYASIHICSHKTEGRKCKHQEILCPDVFRCVPGVNQSENSCPTSGIAGAGGIVSSGVCSRASSETGAYLGHGVANSGQSSGRTWRGWHGNPILFVVLCQ